jgi:hypothetical protein
VGACHGLFDTELCRTALPERSEWRSLILEDASVETLGGLELSIQHNIGGQGEFLPIQWMLNSVTNLFVMKLAKRNTFIINPQGRIATVYAGADAGRNSEQVIADLPKLEAAHP